MVTDDTASGDVWLDPAEGAVRGMKQGAVAVECSTVSVAHIAALRAGLAENDIALVEAPVVGSRPQAEAGQLIHLVGGEAADIVKVLPALEAMSGKVIRAGGIGTGAAMKLLVNGLFSVQVSAVAELLALASALGLPHAEVERVLAATPVLSSASQAAMAGMSKKAFAPLFPISLVAKDMDYLVAAAANLDLSLPLAANVSQLFKAAVSDGLGDMNITAIATRYT
jgi:3-hydroxyisobutyrate dehydrogenase